MHGEDCRVKQEGGLSQVLALHRTELIAPCVAFLLLLVEKGEKVPAARRKGHLECH